MKRSYPLLCFFMMSGTVVYGQIKDNSANKISVLTKYWKSGGIFYGRQPEQEILEGRTAFTKKFSRGNGLVDIYFGGPFHYQDENGGWQDINLAISNEINKGYSYSNKENSFVSGFAGQASGGVQMEYRNTVLKFGINTEVSARNWRLQNVSSIGASLKENKITYPCFQDAALEYQLTTDAILHRLTFNNQSIFSGLTDQQAVIVSETIELPEGAILADARGIVQSDRVVYGSLYVVIGDDTLYTIHPSRAWDASFKGDIEELIDDRNLPAGVISPELSVRFLGTNKFTLSAALPRTWLQSQDRIYPVIFDPTVGVGNQPSFSSGYRYPFNTCRQQRISQILFRKSDINAGGINTTGQITQIDFFQNSNNPISNNGVRVKMQEVTWNVMTTSTLTTSGFTTVFGPSTQNYTSGGTNTWRTLNLSTPFAFANTNNLLVEVSYNNSPNNTSGCSCTNTAPGGYWGWYNAPYAGHRWAYSMSAATPPSGGDCNYSNSPEGNPAYGYFIPATRITINTTGGCVPISFTSQPSSQTVVAPAQAQFSVAVAGTTPTYQWQVSTNGGGTWNNVPAGAPYSGAASNQLTINPTTLAMNGYRYRCVADNNCTNPPVNSSTAVLTVNAAGCATAVTPAASAPIPAAGGTGSFTINVTPNTCSWSATETLSWVTITSPLSGTGDGVLSYTVAANSGTPRSGIISVNGQNHTINQLGAAAPTTYTISGRVIENGSPGLPGVTISTSPAAGTAVTDAQGYYTLNVPLSYTGIVTPALAPFTFTPASRTVSSSNFSNKDFDAVGVTMTVTSSVIPPWQREGDDYNGSITVQISNTTTTSWHIEADVYNASNVHIGNVRFPSVTGNTSQFNTATGTAGAQLRNLSANTRTVKYAAVFDANATLQAYPGQNTLITERKWDKKNVLYKNPSGVIRIPTKYYNNSNQTLKFERVAGTSFTLTGVLPLPKEPFRIWGSYPVSPVDGYATVPYSDLEDLAPGDFEYTVVNTLIPRETALFDLTKYGTIHNGGSNTKAIVTIGGIFNEMEGTGNDLKPCIGNCNANSSFTVLNSLKNNGFDIWYVGQGNGNGVRRNGFDVANAIRQIIIDNPQYTEVDLICHSKGGLDTRAFLQGINHSYDNQSSYQYSSTGPFGKIKRILYLGTPHEGAIMALVFVGGSLALQSQGALDLIPNSTVLNNLNNGSLPQPVQYLNLAGYKSSISTTINPLTLAVTSQYTHNSNDGVVSVRSNNSLGTNFPANNIFQLYQNSNGVSLPHFDLHKQNYLSYLDGYHNLWNCLTATNPTNLAKIVRFFTASLPFISAHPFPTCNEPSFQNITIGTYGSFVSGAQLDYKSALNSNIYSLGRTNEFGNYSGSFSDLFSNTDTLYIHSTGYENAVVPINGEISSSRKIRIALFKELNTSKVSYPVFRIIGDKYITEQPFANVQVSATNVNSFSINLHSSSTTFAPLLLSVGMATIPLDTGLNNVIIRYIGIDTIHLSKDIYYLPGVMLRDYTDTSRIVTSAAYVGSRLFINDQFWGTVNSSGQSFCVFRGDNELKFSKFGYRDTIYHATGHSVINLLMQPHSYSSLTDSTIFDFYNRPNPQYWKTISVNNVSPFSNVRISAKQYDDLFPGMSLKPQTRKFEFRRVESVNVANHKTAIALDQIKTPDKDSVYLLSIKGNRYIKYLPNEAGITEYDPEVQKLAFDKLDFTSNDLHSIVLMQKQGPRMKALDTTWHSGQTHVFPIEMFVEDPDSIRNDITASSMDVKVVVNGNLVYVTAPVNFVGTTTFSLTGTHDWLNRSRTYTMKVIPPEVFIPTGFTPNNDGLNDILKPVFMGKLLYCHFTVFNRYGQKVFETTDCLKGWDGKIKGLEKGSGTYVYYLTYRFDGTSEKEKSAKGTFTIIR